MSVPQPPTEVEPPLKRRKIRKGTTSCWECKKRKVRCQFTSPTSEVCIACTRRLTPCLSQEYDVVGKRLTGMDSNEIGRETLASSTQGRRLERSTTRERVEGPTSSPQPESEGLEDTSALSPAMNSGNAPGPNIQLFDCALHKRYSKISRDLHAALPSQRDADLIIAVGNTPYFLQFFTRPYKYLFAGSMQPASSLSALPSASSHPVLLARTLLYLAHGIQNLHPSTFNAGQLSLGSHAKAMRVFLRTASTLVTSDDEMLSSLEGLECLILEGVYYINAGDLRCAWTVFKRAIALAQLLGLPQDDVGPVILDPKSMASPSFMWYRIVCQDRYLSLMLSLPSGTDKVAITIPEELDLGICLSQRLERTHCVLMGQILARNNTGDEGDYSMTQTIDRALQKAARHMPPEWWLLPSAKRRANGAGDDKLEDVLGILVHITHFQLLILLRLPYMLLSSPERPYNYSEAACVSASRECLNRYIRFRCMDKVAFCCRAIDFSAFIASLALLLAHLDRSCRNLNTVDVLPHHCLSDRAMVQEVFELMKGLNEESGDTDDRLLSQTTSILTYLSSIIADFESQDNDVSVDASNNTDNNDSGQCLRLAIPCFGKARITRHGVCREKHPSEDQRGIKDIPVPPSTSIGLESWQRETSGTVLQRGLWSGSFANARTHQSSVDDLANTEWVQQDFDISQLEELLAATGDYGIVDDLFLFQ
ncbi:unnamed protein product [Clonostachys rosea]|uniref:Zn(2)-C6 fungal-type domain-containing protein n=1 Tax=Bionectria ochroleuca TaxID=29856 RepID=A0ABY6V409_BIOOC|nr:unnamed protein product [Clonostachys rosea]